jgi:peptidoglycan/LPS O-acetylase OafA/YrhL
LATKNVNQYTLDSMGTGVAITVLLSTLASAVPIAWVVLLTWNAIAAISFMPDFYIPQTIGFLLWWVGFVAAWLLARRKIQARSISPSIFISLCLGLIACAWLEFQSWHDSKHLFFPGFFLIPIASCLIVATTAKMLSNHQFERDADGAPQLKR